jgi:hypothetical protein
MKEAASDEEGRPLIERVDVPGEEVSNIITLN